MRESTWYPRLSADGDGSGLVSQAGTLLLVRTAEKVGLVKGLSEALAPWRKPMSTHNPGKIVLDLAIAVAAGGDCASDVSLLRTEPGMFGPVASDPTVSRLVATLAADAPKVLSAITSARSTARARVWKRAGTSAPDHGIDSENPLIIDLDATLLDAHSDKEKSTPTFKRGYGFHP
ncbi:MAG: transposase [Mycobacterium sp.]|nr:transposase [Mycobacterium sp.]